MPDVIAAFAGSGQVIDALQYDFNAGQVLAVGAAAVSSAAFVIPDTVALLTSTTNCWYSIGGTAAAHTPGSDYLPAGMKLKVKFVAGQTISVIQDSAGGFLAVMPGFNQFANPTPGPGVMPPPPLDQLAATAATAYSFRKMRTTYAGKCMKVFRVSDSALQDIGFDASGNFDIAGYNTFIGASTGLCDTWYDQSGNASDINWTSGSARVPINLTGLNGKPTLAFTGGTMQLSRSSTPPAYAQPFTWNAVGYRTGAIVNSGMIGDKNNWSGIYPASASGACTIYAGSNSAGVPCSNGVMHVLTGVFNGSSSTLTVDGTTTSGLSVGSGAVSGAQIGYVGNAPFTGNVSEGVGWSGILSGADIATLGANQKAYWGTP